MKAKKHETKKLAGVAAALALTLGLLAGCSNENNNAENTGEQDKDTYTIGVIQYIEHAALDATYEGFQAALEENGYGDKVTYDYQNAQGDASNLSTIGDRLVSKNVDLVLSITTDATQTMAAKTTDIPILGTAVTSYKVAGLVANEAEPGGNVTGTSDMNPVAAQIDLLAELVPEAKTVGVIYNSSEDNSILQIDIAKTHIEELGLAYEEVTVTNTADVQQAMQSLVSKCDAIYIPTDNTLASAMATVHSVAGEAKIPTICGASTMVEDGGLATMGIDYYDLGYKTGLMAIEVMEGADPATMPIQYADGSDDVTINGQVAEEIGYTVPEKYQDSIVDGSTTE